jgi:hypothetical protein
MLDEIPRRNRSPHGWWIASYLLRAVWEDEPATPDNRHRCLAWENTVIIQAPDREAAYAKALLVAAENAVGEFTSVTGRIGRWAFEGLTGLLPIYEKLEDGAEVLWREDRHTTVGNVRLRVRPKSELEAFDDTPPKGGVLTYLPHR